MRYRVQKIPFATIFVLILLTGAVSGQELDVSVTTDLPTYEIGDLVTIYLHNDSDYEIWTVSEPPIGIYHVESDSFVYPGTGLPVLVLFWPHITETRIWDQIGGPDDTQVPPGHYEVRWSWFTEPPDPPHSGTVAAAFEILSPVAAEPTTWTGVKSLFEQARTPR